MQPAAAILQLFGIVLFGTVVHNPTEQFLAISLHNVYDPTNRLAVLHGDHSDLDWIAWLEGSLVPTHRRHAGGIFRLRRPVRDVPVSICHVEEKHAMGIVPHELCDGPFEVNLVGRIINCIAVVRSERKTRNRNTNSKTENDHEPDSQGRPPVCVTIKFRQVRSIERDSNDGLVQRQVFEPVGSELLWHTSMTIRETLKFKLPATNKNLVHVHVVIAFGADKSRV